jgi:ankyrin repeat protein
MLHDHLQWGRTPIVLAAREGQREIVSLLLEKGAEVNAPWVSLSLDILSAGRYHVTYCARYGTEHEEWMSR